MLRNILASSALRTVIRRGTRNYGTPPPAWTSARGKIHELRQYVLKTECLPNYLALTGSDAFKARTDASPLLGFFLTETGGALNRVVHLWEYEDLDHRTEVRKMLAGDKGFVDYFSQIRPWLAAQQSVLLKPTFFDGTNAAGGSDEGSANGGFFALQSFNPADEPSRTLPTFPGAAFVGKWDEVVGNTGTKWQLFSAPSYQKLLSSERVTMPNASTTFMAPTPFSPMQ